jgi:hypothetical protein
MAMAEDYWQDNEQAHDAFEDFVSCTLCFSYDHVRADCTLELSLVCDACFEH